MRIAGQSAVEPTQMHTGLRVIVDISNRVYETGCKLASDLQAGLTLSWIRFYLDGTTPSHHT
jgi:hypothetical protein